MDKYESEHNKTIERYAMLIKQLFGIALNEFAQVASIVEGDYSGNEMFNFDDYPQTKATVAKIVNTLANNMNVSVVNGCKAVWDISNKKNNALVESLFKGKDLTDEQKIRYFQNNEPALNAFTERKHNGLRLSDRVWNIVGGYKNDIETALSVSIEQGKSAHDLAKEVQQYLNEPDKLFRRVRDEFGELQLSKNAKSYHPGAGVYRSSYKNALRLARTEINMAYRTADFTRYQQLDFIVGIEIKTSGNHPEHDICDQLAGRYPKDFKFVGWHPNCRCYQKTILKTEEEMERDEERMRKGQEPTANSKNSVNDVPDEFKEWMADNSERIKRAKHLPYFIMDNQTYTQDYDVFAGSVSDSKKLTDKLQSTEKYLGNKANKEVGYVYNIKGNLVFKQGGSYDRINFDDAQMKQMNDCVLTHNHTSGHNYKSDNILSIGSSFSYKDVETAVKGNLAEIRAVTPHYTFSLKRPSTGWDSEMLRQYTLVRNRIIEYYDAKELPENRKDIFDMIIAHLVMKELKKIMRLDYTKHKITSV